MIERGRAGWSRRAADYASLLRPTGFADPESTPSIRSTTCVMASPRLFVSPVFVVRSSRVTAHRHEFGSSPSNTRYCLPRYSIKKHFNQLRMAPAVSTGRNRCEAIADFIGGGDS